MKGIIKMSKKKRDPVTLTVIICIVLITVTAICCSIYTASKVGDRDCSIREEVVEEVTGWTIKKLF
jgi:hypothetical protein